MQIGQLQPNHYPAAAQLLELAWDEFAKNTELSLDQLYAGDSARNWLNDYILLGGLGYVASINQKVVGVIIGKVELMPGYSAYPKQLKIFDISIDPDYRKQGIAKALELACEEYAKANHIGLITGEVFAYNDASRSLMKSLGRKLGYEVWYKKT